MIVTVTPNPALDFTYQLPAVHLGQSHRVLPPAVRAGGKGINVARILHSRGVPVLSLATVGGCTGAEFESDLIVSAIPHRLTHVQAATRRTMAFTESKGARASIFNEFGANNTPAEWGRLTYAVETALSDATCLVGSGSLPEGADTNFYAHLVGRAQALGIPSIVDTTGPALLAAARAGVTLIKPNEQELTESTGEEDSVRAARALIDLGAQNILVSLGERGMFLISAANPGEPWRGRLPRILAGNATGAGDAAVAAAATFFSTAFSSGPAPYDVDPHTILSLSISWSAAAVLMPLAGEISSEQVTLATEVIISRKFVNCEATRSPVSETKLVHHTRGVTP